MGRKILVVDDEPEIRDLAALILQAGGYEVRSVSSGSEAIEEAHRERPDLILLDVNMPEMDGWEALRLLKADAQVGTLPVVMFTVKSEFRDKVHALQDGAFGYITKPFTYDELLKNVENIFTSLKVSK